VKDNDGKSYIAKIFSDMAKDRRPMSDFPVDMLASDNELGPHIVACTPNGILMEHLDGKTLEESAIHSVYADGLLNNIAHSLKRLHALPLPKGDNMLWYSLDVMLEDCSFPALLDAHAYQENLLGNLDLPECCGHGDFKAANVILSSADKIKFIDFELSGRQYRGFDVAKLFRTADAAKFSSSNFQYFCRIYGDNVQLEAELCMPLTVRLIHRTSSYFGVIWLECLIHPLLYVL